MNAAEEVQDLQVQQTRNSLHDEFAWNYAQMGALKRMLAAKSLGLPVDQFGKLPPGSTITVINGPNPDAGFLHPRVSPTMPHPEPPLPLPAKSIPYGTLASILLGLVGTGLSGTALGFLLNRPASVVAAPPLAPAPAPQPALAPTAPVVQPDGFIVQDEKFPDGSTKVLWSLPAKQLPDGTAQSIDGRRWRSPDGKNWVEIK